MAKLKNKTIVITGSSGKIGSSLVLALAKEKANVIATDINLENIEQYSINHKQLKIKPMYMDITDKDSIDQVITKTTEEYGSIDTIINNAYPRNTNYGKDIEDVTYEDFCENIDMHLGGYFLTSQRFSLHFKKNKSGNIINMASIYGVMPPRFDIYRHTSMTMPVEYAAIKSAIIHLTKYFAQFYKNIPIRVNSISPGGIHDSQPKSFIDAYNMYCGNKGMLDADDLSGLLIFLSSNESQRITGQNFVIDDGFSL